MNSSVCSSTFFLRNVRVGLGISYATSVKIERVKAERRLYIKKNPVAKRAFPRIALIGYQTIAFVLSFFRNVVSESKQKDSLKNAQDDPKIR